MGSGRLSDSGSIMAHESIWKDIVYSASCVNEMTCHDSACRYLYAEKKEHRLMFRITVKYLTCKFDVI